MTQSQVRGMPEIEFHVFAPPSPSIVRPATFTDDRGFFSVVFNQDQFEEQMSTKLRFIQDNHSRSKRGVLRGLHYQLDPMAQGKLVRVARGAVFDVVVDIRQASPTFGSWAGVELSDSNLVQLWIPPGFAHGFLALSDPSDVVYKVTNTYSKELDRSIRWDDPEIGIHWPLDESPIVSDKDGTAPLLREADVPS